MTNETTGNEPNNPGVWPAVLYRDADAALGFLTKVFGFTEALTVRGDDGQDVVHGELLWPEGGGLMYGTVNADEGAGSVSGLYVVTADPDAVHRRAVAAGAKVVMEPYDTDYGSHNVGLADPEGNSWTFGTYPGASR